MSGFLLDTDTLSLAQFGHATVVANLASHVAADVALPVIALQEQMRGWLNRLTRLTSPPQLADWYDRLVGRMFPVWRSYSLLSFTEPTILRFEHLRSLKLNVGLMDLRIAAIALENGLTVVTRNQRDFGRVPGLVTADWSA
ncbi:MAG TPA: type II toxin-antitoxin system VapC family toxin [Gemmataceae bacterium]|nr:type II toxin-antitoxin system VapC family toxin [Gemmataceae bacterium]